MIKWAVGLVVFVGMMCWGVVYAQTPVQPGETVRCLSGPFRNVSGDRDLAFCPGPTVTRILTPTATLTTTATTTLTPIAVHPNHWHPPTDHEHGDEPPSWVTAYSLATFGHGVIFGGNETSSPAENSMKHQAFKGITLRSSAGGELYWRYHAGSNPMDRSAQFHSWEAYYKDASGGISFFEGHYDTGNPNDPAHRCERSDESGCTRPIILVVNQDAWDAGIRNEQWYMHHFGLSFGVQIAPVTTLYGGLEENATAHDLSTWILTGGVGNSRMKTTEVLITDWVANLEPGPYCAPANGHPAFVQPMSITCGDLALPMQWNIAPTLVLDLRDEEGVMRISAMLGDTPRVYNCPLCVVPN